MKNLAYFLGDAPVQFVDVRDISYDSWEDVFTLTLEDNTTLLATYIEKTNDGWNAGLPENY